MARRRYGRRRRGRSGMKIPIISTAILVGQIAFAHSAAGGDIKETLNNFQSFYTGVYFGGGAGAQFQPQRLIVGHGPWLAKRFIFAVSRPRMPIRGLPISLS